jgi:hypothetical protein
MAKGRAQGVSLYRQGEPRQLQRPGFAAGEDGNGARGISGGEFAAICCGRERGREKKGGSLRTGPHRQ